jgi:hypothetical protein
MKTMKVFVDETMTDLLDSRYRIPSGSVDRRKILTIAAMAIAKSRKHDVDLGSVMMLHVRMVRCGYDCRPLINWTGLSDDEITFMAGMTDEEIRTFCNEKVG